MTSLENAVRQMPISPRSSKREQHKERLILRLYIPQHGQGAAARGIRIVSLDAILDQINREQSGPGCNATKATGKQSP
jgi:hypothetical protein